MDVIPLFPKANHLIINSGNILNWSKLVKIRTPKTSSDEVYEVLEHTLRRSLLNQDKNELQYATNLVCRDSQNIETYNTEERKLLKLTAKIFMSSNDPESLREAIKNTFLELGVEVIDSLIVACAEKDEESDLLFSDLRPIWTVVEDFLNKKTITNAGVADLDYEMLSQLYNWATIKPTIDQIHLADCCVLPPKLREFAKEKEIQLLTHNDSPVILSNSQFQQIVTSIATNVDGVLWNLSWLTRYTIMVTCRGVIQNKGFVGVARRDLQDQSST